MLACGPRGLEDKYVLGKPCSQEAVALGLTLWTRRVLVPGIPKSKWGCGWGESTSPLPQCHYIPWHFINSSESSDHRFIFVGGRKQTAES